MCKHKFYFSFAFSILVFSLLGIFYCSFSKSKTIPLEVLFSSPEKSNPLISPDGKKIAYLAPIKGVRNIWIKTLALVKEDEPLTQQLERDILSFFWSYDNEYIFYLQDKAGDENHHLYRVNISTKEKKDMTPFDGAKVGTVSYKKYFPSEMLLKINKRDKKVFDVYKLNLENGDINLVTKNTGNFVDWVSDEYNKVRAARVARDDGGFDGFVRDNEESPWRKIVSWSLEDNDSHFLGFSKDGNFVYALDSRNYNTVRLVKIDVKTGKLDVISQDPNYDFKYFIRTHDSCDPKGGIYYKDRREWVFFDNEFENNMKAAMQLDNGDVYISGSDADFKKWTVVFIKDNGPTSYWIFDTETKTGEFLFCSRPKLNDYKLVNMEPVSFTSRDGLKINGYLSCPNKKRKNLPMVLFVHGGPWFRDVWGYDPVAQWLANRGYAVLQVNFRGSTGYGKEFLNAGNKQWGLKMQDDLVDAVNWAISSELASPEKIAIFGGSYGGYAALVGAAFTPDLFCCAIDLSGPTNLVTLMKTIPPYWTTKKNRLKKRIGDIETEEEFLKSCSPLFKADQIKIPVMVIQGANDPRVKQAEAEQIIAAMGKNGVKYEYLLFEDEGHGLVKEENRMKFYRTAEDFLKKYLG